MGGSNGEERDPRSTEGRRRPGLEVDRALFLFAALATVIQSPVAAAHFVTSVVAGVGSAGESLLTFFGEVS
ncbi:hypothetical protein GCM10020366_00100 [Saccharopolyspora gregorii]|uniref:MFS transporter n=1 Tax=Saccharopolyspora gregorii TaxID=33914 RepID=A0ABP6RGD5_9PSEU